MYKKEILALVRLRGYQGYRQKDIDSLGQKPEPQRSEALRFPSFWDKVGETHQKQDPRASSNRENLNQLTRLLENP